MDTVWHIIIGGMVVYALIYLLRELAVVLVLTFRGRIVSAELAGVFGFGKLGRWEQRIAYRYTVLQHEYRYIRARSLFFHSKPSNTVELQYLPDLPSLARQRVNTIMRLGQILFYSFFTLIFAAVLTISPIINTLAIYTAAVCIVAGLVIWPRLAMHPVLIYFFEPRIPKYALREES
jgi:hypothetical protein